MIIRRGLVHRIFHLLLSLVILGFSLNASAQFLWKFAGKSYPGRAEAEAALQAHPSPQYLQFAEAWYEEVLWPDPATTLYWYTVFDYQAATDIQFSGYTVDKLCGFFDGTDCNGSIEEAVNSSYPNPTDILCDVQFELLGDFEFSAQQWEEALDHEILFWASEDVPLRVDFFHINLHSGNCEYGSSANRMLHKISLATCENDLSPLSGNHSEWLAPPDFPEVCSPAGREPPISNIAAISKRLTSVCTATAGNPCSPMTGHKSLRETDFRTDHIEFTRHYNSSLELGSTGMGKGWSHSYSAKLILNNRYTLVKADGNAEEFSKTATDNHRSITTPGKILTDADDLVQLLYPGGRKEIYQRVTPTGYGAEQFRLIEIYAKDLPDRSIRLAYSDPTGLLESVTGPFGRQIHFSYAEGDRISALILPDGQRIEYNHDQKDNLSEVIFQDGTTRRYLYENTAFPNHLTGIIDENNRHFATYQYDQYGRATLSEHAGGADRVSLNYLDSGTTEVTSPSGDIRTYFFDPFEQAFDVSDISDGNGITTYSRNSFGWPTEKTDAAGHTSQFSYDPYHMVRRVDGLGTTEERITNYTWDDTLNRKTQIEEPGTLTTFTYDTEGRLMTKSVEDQAGGFSRDWTYNYYPATEQQAVAGRLQSIDGPRTDVADITSYSYYLSDDPGGKYNAGDLHTAVNAAGHVMEYLEYDGNGRLTRVRDANDVMTEFSYHSRGWMNSHIFDGQTTVFSYDGTGNLLRTISPDGSYIDYAYDDAHRLIKLSDGSGNHIEYTLDLAGNRIAEYTFDNDGTLRRQLYRTFNAIGQMEKLTDGNGDSSRYSYDGNGSRISLLDENLNTTRYEYDALNRMAKTVDPLLGETVMGFDARDNLVQVTDPLGNATHYSYDGLNNPLSLSSPDSGTVLNEFDAAGNRITTIDARGIRVEYSYDELNRRTGISYPDSSLDVTFSYDAGSNGKGRLSGMTDAAGTVNYRYDSRGNLLSETRDIGFDQYITRYSYNASGRLVQIEYPSGRVVTYSLDFSGKTIAVNSASEILVTDIRYAPFGPVTSFTYGNGLSYSANFNQDYELLHLQSGSGLDSILEYDPAGNILGINNHAFSYDGLHRLESASGSAGNQSYEYDANGNRIQQLDGLIDHSYTYEIQTNRLATKSGWTYTRDAAGNRTAKLDQNGDGWFYHYGDHNRLVDIVEQNSTGNTLAGSYLYDARGRRVSKMAADDETHFIYNLSGQLLGEYSAGDVNEYLEYVYLEGIPVAIMSRSAETVTPPGTELILDNSAPGTSSTGSWRSKSNARAYGPDYLLASKSNNASFRWTASPPGNAYRVYAWWVDKKNQSQDVNYSIRYGSGQIDTVTRSHRAGGGQWQLLGTYNSVDGQDYVEVRSDSNKFVADAIRWVSVNDPVTTVSDLIYYVHFDHLGTPRQVTSASQSVVWNWISAPFGDSAPDQDPDGDSNDFVLNLRFPGQYFDAESSLHYNYFRTYDPETGRYIESDPIGLRSSLNTFAYVDSNPIISIDPSGLIKLYGSWCGPDWTGGFRKSYDELDAVERSVALPPVDILDQCCQTHDITYADCRSQFPCDADSRQQCFQKADRRLSNCASNSGGGQSPQFLMFGNPQKRIKDYMKDSKPGAGKNAADCGCE